MARKVTPFSLYAHIKDGLVGVKHSDGSWAECNEGGHRYLSAWTVSSDGDV